MTVPVWVSIAGILILAFGIIALVNLWLPKCLPRSRNETSEVSKDFGSLTRSVAGKIDAPPRGIGPLFQPEIPTANQWTRLQLTAAQRRMILDAFDDEVLETTFRPHLQLEIFAEMIRASKPDESIPVYYAQRIPLGLFAVNRHLDWLSLLLTQSVVEEQAS